MVVGDEGREGGGLARTRRRSGWRREGFLLWQVGLEVAGHRVVNVVDDLERGWNSRGWRGVVRLRGKGKSGGLGKVGEGGIEGSGAVAAAVG